MEHTYRYIDEFGSFELEGAENDLGLYFPLAGEKGVKASVTPNLGGDSKIDQNHFLMEPVSIENLHNNRSGRNFWCLVDGKEPWSAVGASARQEADRLTEHQESSLVRAGRMWHETERTGREIGLKSRITNFVPVDGTAEVMLVEISNISDKNIEMTAVAAIPIFGRSADNIRDHRHVTSLLHRISLTDHGVQVKPTLSFDERGHGVNEMIYFAEGADGKGDAPVKIYPEVDGFCGRGGTLTHPEMLYRRDAGLHKEHRKIRQGQEALGGLEFQKVCLSPGEKAVYTILLGAVSDQEIEKAEQLKTSLLKERNGKQLLEETRAYWKEKTGVAFHTGDAVFDQYMNWVSFQPELRKIYGCSFLPHHDYGKGGRGWRDLWQDCLALLLMNPSAVREMLVANFAGVRVDGTNATIIGTKPGEFKADRNAITRVWSDHGIWPLITTVLYMEQSGDYDILYEKMPYFKDRQGRRGREADVLWQEETWQQDKDGHEISGTILEHLLLQQLTSFYEAGDHNNLQLRDADWNDALDMAREKGETVAFTCALAMNLRSLAEILEHEKSRGIETVELLKEMELLLKADESLHEDPEKKRALLNQYLTTCLHTVSGERIFVSAGHLAELLRQKADWIGQHIRKNEVVTDEAGRKWFNSYYDDHGRAVDGDGTMLLTGQVFAIMSGIADRELTIAAAEAADHYLYDASCGGYRLNTDLEGLRMDLGRMSGFAYGEKENGAVFSHMAVMYSYALYSQGAARQGHKALHALYRQSVDFETSRIYPGIPEYFNNEGRGLYHYLTGAASWYLLTMITQAYGIRGKGGDLLICPQLVKEQFDENQCASIRLRFAGRDLKITLQNKESLDCGEYEVGGVLMDGEVYRRDGNSDLAEMQGILIPREYLKTLSEKDRHEIMIELRRIEK